jgi:hypothetical protein
VFEEQLAAVPAHPPRSGVLPGMRLRAAVPRSAAIILLGFVFLFGSFPFLMVSSDPRQRLQLSGLTTEGHVVSLVDAASSGCRGSARRLVYEFKAQSGGAFRGAVVQCEDSPYYSAKAGDSIEILYLRDNPGLNSIASVDPSEPPLLLFTVFPVFFLLLFSPLFLPQLREVLRARRLYKTGLLVRGQVVFVKKRSFGVWPGWPVSGSFDVYVSQESPGGGRVEIVAWCTNDWLVNRLAPGATVHVLCPPNPSARGALLEAFIR